MGKYKLQISASAEKALKRIPQQDLPRIIAKIQGLSTDPYPPMCRKLTGEKNTYRVRAGLYRIIYEVKKTHLIIQVLKIGHRKDIYR